MKWMFIVLLLLPLVSCLDSQIILTPGSDTELVLDYLDDAEIFFMGGVFTSPVVTLLEPGNNTEDSDGIIDLYFTVNGYSLINNCSLYLDGIYEDTNYNITLDTTETFRVISPPVTDDLEWNVTCIDQFGNQGSQKFVLDTREGFGTPGGGGGGFVPDIAGQLGIKNVSIELCRLTKDSAEERTTSFINQIIKDFEKRTNQTANWYTVRLYIENWQGICSDLINRTLKEEEVCDYIYNFTKNREMDANELHILTIELNRIVPISSRLVEYYINNFDDRCPKFKFALIEEENDLWFLLCFLMIIFLVVLFINRRRIFILLKKFPKNKD